MTKLDILLASIVSLKLRGWLTYEWLSVALELHAPDVFKEYEDWYNSHYHFHTETCCDKMIELLKTAIELEKRTQRGHNFLHTE